MRSEESRIYLESRIGHLRQRHLSEGRQGGWSGLESAGSKVRKPQQGAQGWRP